MSRKIVALWLGLWGSYLAHAQQEGDQGYADMPLKMVIQQLENDFNIRFSYAEDAIADKSVTLNTTDLRFTEILGALEAQTGLHFEKIEDRPQVIIVPQEPALGMRVFLLDEESRLPITETQVTIDSVRVAQTDSKGLLRFSEAGKEQYTLQVPGYGTASVAASETYAPIYLAPVYQELKEVVVTSYITTGIDRNRDGSITLAQKPLGLIPGQTTPDILQSIQMIPGVNSLDETASGVQIHGGTSDQNLVLFDHIRVFNTGYLYGMFSRFNPYATKKATIFKSGTSAVYGDRVSGVINIETDDEVAHKFSGGVGIDGLNADGYLKIPITPKSSVSLFARNSYLDLYKSPTYKAYARKIFNNTGSVTDRNGRPLDLPTDDDYTYESSQNNFRFYDFDLKYVYQPSPKDKISLSALMTRNRTHFSFTTTEETEKDSLTTGNGGVSLNWTHHTSPTQTEQLTTYFSSYDSYYFNEELYGENLEETNIRGNRISDFGFEMKSDRTFKNNDHLAFGYQLSNTNLEIDLSSISQVSPENDLSLPVHESNFKNVLFGEYTLRDRTSGTYTLGLRMVHYGSLGRVYLEPRLNMELPLSKNLRIRAGLERRNQPISQLVEFNQTELRLENNLWRLSDQVEYPILQSKQGSMGLLYDRDGWTLDAEAYYKWLTGLTSYSQGFNLPQPTLSEGKSRIMGVDLLIKKRWDAYRFWIGYSLGDVNFTFGEIQKQSFSGNNDITHNFRVANSLEWDRFQFSLGWQYRTGTPTTPINSFNPDTKEVSFGALNSYRLPAFHRLDASVVYNIPLKPGSSQMQLGLSALNLYNRKVPLARVYRTSQQDNRLLLDQVIFRHSLGFAPNLTLRVFF